MSDNPTKVQEKPILFSGAMVRKIIEDLKTNTRRVFKDMAANVRIVDGTPKGFLPGIPEGWVIPCPYGKPGDRLWVRETFCLQNDVDGDDPPFNDGRPIQRFDDDPDSNIAWYQPHYRATDPVPELCCERENCQKANEPHVHWQPSIHMPRWASRLTLEIVSVKVERVQDISEEDAKAEGCSPEVVTAADVADLQISDVSPAIKELGRILGPGQFTAKHDFSKLWDSINAKREGGKYAWASNPWVWALTFKRLS